MRTELIELAPVVQKGDPLDESLFLWIEQLASLILILWIEDIDIYSVDGAIQRLNDRSFDRCGLNTLAFV